MWSVRDMFAADPEGTLRALDIGYRQIELAGIPPSARHEACGRSSMRLASAHTRATSTWDVNNFDEANYRAQLERAVSARRRTG